MNPNILISIGNSDDRLSQQRWSGFIRDVRAVVDHFVDLGDIELHGEWFSAPDSPWQNANWCVQIIADFAPGSDDYESARRDLRADLAQVRDEYRQQSYAWTEGAVEFVSAEN